MKRSAARARDAIEFARDQRAAANEFAQAVWQWVRHRKICGQKFRREYPVPPYTADFCCVELKLILEIDGAEHLTETGQQRDRVRDEGLAGQGYRVARISGFDVVRDGRQVLERIVQEVKRRMKELGAPSPLTPLPETGRGEKEK
ncbi:MAG: endonuclease domain-containing protein [Planctomycetia bacterium]|nr:endonuclease domain-containing protein [Planctomycetia bacterium]